LPVVLVWVVVPAIVGIALFGISVRSIVLDSSAAQVALGTLAISLIAISLWTLKRIVSHGAWPTYLPYYGIAVAMPLVVIQVHLARAKGSA
jgi:hypothetical protein